MKNQHQCAAIGCAKRVPEDLLMCNEHWFSLPKDLRARVWRYYRAKLRGLPDAEELYRHYVREAIYATAKRDFRDRPPS